MKLGKVVAGGLVGAAMLAMGGTGQAAVSCGGTAATSDVSFSVNYPPVVNYYATSCAELNIGDQDPSTITTAFNNALTGAGAADDFTFAVRDESDSGGGTGSAFGLNFQLLAANQSNNGAYTLIWTDPAQAGRAADLPFSYTYTAVAGNLPELPVNFPGCAAPGGWAAACRSIINYETHIHPLWSVDRGANTCTTNGCHVPRNAAGMLAVPAAQLDLDAGLSPQVMEHFNSYRELLFADNAQEVVNNALQDIQLGVDADGNPILVTVLPSMSAVGANASDRFFDIFDAGGTHFGRLSPDELRLIAEWLDIGAQYYNNPFDVPVN